MTNKDFQSPISRRISFLTGFHCGRGIEYVRYGYYWSPGSSVTHIRVGRQGHSSLVTCLVPLLKPVQTYFNRLWTNFKMILLEVIISSFNLVYLKMPSVLYQALTSRLIVFSRVTLERKRRINNSIQLTLKHENTFAWKYFRITGPLWGESTGFRWMVSQWACNALTISLLIYPDRALEQTAMLQVIGVSQQLQVIHTKNVMYSCVS